MGLTIEKLEQWRNEKPDYRSYKVEAEPERYRNGHHIHNPVRAWLWDYDVCFGSAIYSDAEIDYLDLVALKRDENMRTLERIKAEMAELGGEVE